MSVTGRTCEAYGMYLGEANSSPSTISLMQAFSKALEILVYNATS